MAPSTKASPTTDHKGSRSVILAVDFDRVIHDVDHPLPGRRMGPPMPGAEDYLKALHYAGHTIVVYTTRAQAPAGFAHVREWLRWWKIPYDDITALKPSADFYIDDKAVKFESWPAVYEVVTANSPNHKERQA